jgi:deoxyribonuclease-4
MDGRAETVQDSFLLRFVPLSRETPMPLLGAHMSIAGGYYKAVEAAAELRMECVQIFTKNNNQWRGKPLLEEDVDQFREAIVRTGIRMPCAHDSYLINLASPDGGLWTKSLDAFVIELERAEALGLVGVVMHPGSCVGACEEDGIGRVVKALRTSLERTESFSVEIWLETTAGQGSSLGQRFEHLRDILDGLGWPSRVGVCVDSCHLLAAGYPLTLPAEYAETMRQFDDIVGIDRIRAFHLNDSKRAQGSRVDRHEHVGKGYLGREAFRNILTDKRFAAIPMYLETPKGVENGRSLDAQNLATLRRLARRPTKASHNRKSR